MRLEGAANSTALVHFNMLMCSLHMGLPRFSSFILEVHKSTTVSLLRPSKVVVFVVFVVAG
jgi:hypothetical protein